MTTSLPTSTSEDPTQTVIDILSGITTDGDYGADYGESYGGLTWVNEEPEVYSRWDTTPQGRKNNPNPALYVWSPVERSVDRMDAEGSYYREDTAIEVSVWTLDPVETEEYHRDVIQILKAYDRDNMRDTTFHKIEPTSVSDRRSEKIVRQTDHYVMSVQASVEAHRE